MRVPPPAGPRSVPGGYDRPVRSLPTVLLVLSLPVGALAYALTVQVLEAMGVADAGQGLLALFVPLFVAGLVMLPFLIPFFDRKAKADLAAYRASQAAAGIETGGEPPDSEAHGTPDAEAPDDAPDGDAPNAHEMPR